MMKRLTFILMALVTSVASFALSLAGKTYKGSFKSNGATVTVTYKFTSDKEGIQTFLITMKGREPVKAEARIVYIANSDEVIFKDENGEEGSMAFNNGNLQFASAYSPDLITLRPVGASSGNSGAKKKTSKRR